MFTQMANIQPEMIAVGAFHPKPLANMMGHPAGNHIPGCQLSLFRLVFMHEPLFIHIQKSTAVTSTALRNQNIGRHDTGGVKLDCFRIAQGHHLSV